MKEEMIVPEEEQAVDNSSEKNALYTERMELESRLSGSDYKVTKCMEAQLAGLEMPYDVAELHTQRKAWRDRIGAIDADLAALDGIEPTEAEQLEKAKAAKIAEIDEYNISANVNAFTVGGNPMWLNFDQRARLKNSIEAAEADGEERLTKVYGGVTFTYPIARWYQMFYAVENYAGACQNVTDQHKAEVMAMTTLAEVEAFDITVGYPPHPAF